MRQLIRRTTLTVIFCIIIMIVTLFRLVVEQNLAKETYKYKKIDGFQKSTTSVSNTVSTWESQKPIILIWKAQFGHEIEYLANEDICGRGIHCDITYDKNLLHQAESVVFHFTMNQAPTWRSPDQLYVWWTAERTQTPFNHFDNFYNLTFTYRLDSDVYAPYGSIHLILEELRKSGETDLEELLRKKRESGRIAAWAVSNCGVTGRNQVAKKLQESGIKLEKFGKCNRRNIGKGAYSKDFYDELSTYKFYFAFENGYHCKDYITEKFWFNGLRSGAVPIVWGAKKEEILKVAPTKSFIHVDDFKSIEDLTKYLIYLSENEEEYKKYLVWRNWATKPELIEGRLRKENLNGDLRSFCSLCKILLDQRQRVKNGSKRSKYVVPSLTTFWNQGEHSDCSSK